MKRIKKKVATPKAPRRKMIAPKEAASIAARLIRKNKDLFRRLA